MAGELTPHGAAMALFNLIAWSEGKSVATNLGNANAPSRDWILMTYGQCLQLATEPRTHPTVRGQQVPPK